MESSTSVPGCAPLPPAATPWASGHRCLPTLGPWQLASNNDLPPTAPPPPPPPPPPLHGPLQGLFPPDLELQTVSCFLQLLLCPDPKMVPLGFIPGFLLPRFSDLEPDPQVPVEFCCPLDTSYAVTSVRTHPLCPGPSCNRGPLGPPSGGPCSVPAATSSPCPCPPSLVQMPPSPAQRCPSSSCSQQSTLPTAASMAMNTQTPWSGKSALGLCPGERKTGTQQILVHSRPEQHNHQKGNSPNVHQWVNGYRKCGKFTQWNIMCPHKKERSTDTHTTMWMNFKNIRLSERSQSQMVMYYHMISSK